MASAPQPPPPPPPRSPSPQKSINLSSSSSESSDSESSTSSSGSGSSTDSDSEEEPNEPSPQKSTKSKDISPKKSANVPLAVKEKSVETSPTKKSIADKRHHKEDKEEPKTISQENSSSSTSCSNTRSSSNSPQPKLDEDEDEDEANNLPVIDEDSEDPQKLSNEIIEELKMEEEKLLMNYHNPIVNESPQCEENNTPYTPASCELIINSASPIKSISSSTTTISPPSPSPLPPSSIPPPTPCGAVINKNCLDIIELDSNSDESVKLIKSSSHVDKNIILPSENSIDFDSKLNSMADLSSDCIGLGGKDELSELDKPPPTQWTRNKDSGGSEADTVENPDKPAEGALKLTIRNNSVEKRIVSCPPKKRHVNIADYPSTREGHKVKKVKEKKSKKHKKEKKEKKKIEISSGEGLKLCLRIGRPAEETSTGPSASEDPTPAPLKLKFSRKTTGGGYALDKSTDLGESGQEGAKDCEEAR
uniref:Uncharacterized protein n=1 Tax=Megaselia scalaris TaxID=36166 RepID=T1GS21_MEGSC